MDLGDDSASAPDGENGYIDPKRDIGIVSITSATSDGGVRVMRSERIKDRIEFEVVQGKVGWMTSKTRVEG